MKRSVLLLLVAQVLFVSPTALAGSGDTIWTKRYTGPGHYYDDATAIAVSPNGAKVYVTGFSKDATTDYDYATIAYDGSTGAKVWVNRYDGPGHYYDDAAAIAVSPNGRRVFVTGSSKGATTGFDYATVAYDDSTGAEIWTARYEGPGNRSDGALALAISPDGTRVYVTGASRGSGTYSDYATVAYDASTGAEIWTTRYNGPASRWDGATGIAVSRDGTRVYVTGFSKGVTTGHSDYATVAYDASTGAEIWTTRYDGPASAYDYPQALMVSPDGAMVYVTGGSDGLSTGFDFATVAYNATTGARIWTRRYRPGSAYDYAQDLVVSPDGARLYVTGVSGGSTGHGDFATIAYNAITGARIWTRRYGGPGHGYDQPNALAVSPDGARVYVTGDTGFFWLL